MPELPEVETTLRGLTPHLIGQTVCDVRIRTPQLRWAIPPQLPDLLRRQTVRSLHRRAKYLLLEFDHGTLILHLGMSGSLRLLPADTAALPHEHFDLVFSNGTLMRLRDPRRFGSVLWHQGDAMTHPLLEKLGVEPLGDAFTGPYLFQATRARNAAIKLIIMDHHVVVGIGNIYANEALFHAGIRPDKMASKLSKPRYTRLVQTLRDTLTVAIEKGGSSLRDFVGSDGSSGHFQQNYFVYDHTGEPCRTCNTVIRQITQGQRSSFYCAVCQK